MRESMKNLPERIYLNLGDDCPEDADFSDLSEVTWSEDKMFPSDVEYSRRPEWTSVDERLPGTYTDVLIVTDKGQIRVSHLKVARKTVWAWPGNFLPKVIAWMPLPALPKFNPESE